MPDFQFFRDADLEDEDLQEQVISVVNTAIANEVDLEDSWIFYWALKRLQMPCRQNSSATHITSDD